MVSNKIGSWMPVWLAKLNLKWPRKIWRFFYDNVYVYRVYWWAGIALLCGVNLFLLIPFAPLILNNGQLLPLQTNRTNSEAFTIHAGLSNAKIDITYPTMATLGQNISLDYFITCDKPLDRKLKVIIYAGPVNYQQQRTDFPSQIESEYVAGKPTWKGTIPLKVEMDEESSELVILATALVIDEDASSATTVFTYSPTEIRIKIITWPRYVIQFGLFMGTFVTLMGRDIILAIITAVSKVKAAKRQ